MSISIIFPIEIGDNGNIVTSTSSSVVKRTALGVSSFADQSPAAAIKQNLKMLLLTRKGEYIMDINYGVGLPDYLFLQEQEVDINFLEADIRGQVAKYMPYVSIKDINIRIDESSPTLAIKFVFNYNGVAIPEIFELEVI